MSTERLRRSKFHIWKTLLTKSVLISDSQARHINAGNLNILSLPGAGIRHICDFRSPKDGFELIILFVGGIDVYDGF